MKKLTPFLAKGNATFLKRLLLTFVFFAPIFTGNLTHRAEVKAQATTTYCGVSDSEVVKYLSEYGYVVHRLEPEPGTCNKIATTQNSYKTIVFISESCIVGYEDLP